MEIIKVDLPYPSVEVEKDVRTALAVLPAYADVHGELNAILTYTYNGFYFEKYGLENIKKTISGIAVCEMEHLEILGKLLLNLGLDPKYYYNSLGFNYYDTSFVCYSKDPQLMLMDEITSEMIAVETYAEIEKKVSSFNVKAVLKRIKMDEELHVLTLKEALKDYEKLKGR